MPDTRFAAAVERNRRERFVHCYRMLGSVHDAQELVLDTMTRAWRARGGSDDEHPAAQDRQLPATAQPRRSRE
jgi:RNA polymerase sigma-70 factor (ECF subfamily)